jgi:hypothetical protein
VGEEEVLDNSDQGVVAEEIFACRCQYRNAPRHRTLKESPNYLLLQAPRVDMRSFSGICTQWSFSMKRPWLESAKDQVKREHDSHHTIVRGDVTVSGCPFLRTGKTNTSQQSLPIIFMILSFFRRSIFFTSKWTRNCKLPSLTSSRTNDLSPPALLQ